MFISTRATNTFGHSRYSMMVRWPLAPAITANFIECALRERSRNDLSNARSAVFHILPDGSTDILWSSASVTGFSVLATQGGVLIGTSDKGRVYSVTDNGRDTLLLQSSEGQISSLVTRGTDVF